AAVIAGGADWLVVDHYAIDWRWQQRLRASAARIMVIDDLANRRHDCDVLLDQNLHREMQARYREYVPHACRLLLGPEYALLRREFHAAHMVARRRDGSISRLLVFMGGGDGGNFTSTGLAAVRQLDMAGLGVEAIVGRQQ